VFAACFDDEVEGVGDYDACVGCGGCVEFLGCGCVVEICFEDAVSKTVLRRVGTPSASKGAAP
jgi:hypothetical protein